MCTLSWLPDVAGFRLFFNRDERLTRGPASPPRIDTMTGLRFLAPVDGDFGGTWIGVNQLGIAVALLNRYHDGAGPLRSGRVSRGLLVRNLLGCTDPQAVSRSLTALEPGSYAPFTIAIVKDGRKIALADWNGGRLAWTDHTAAGLVRTSSGHDQLAAERHRAVAFKGLRRGPLTATRLRRIHRSHLPARGAASVCMHRSDAATQSFVELRVTATEATIRYHPGPPCEGRPAVVRHLALGPPR